MQLRHQKKRIKRNFQEAMKKLPKGQKLLRDLWTPAPKARQLPRPQAINEGAGPSQNTESSRQNEREKQMGEIQPTAGPSTAIATEEDEIRPEEEDDGNTEGEEFSSARSRSPLRLYPNLSQILEDDDVPMRAHGKTPPREPLRQPMQATKVLPAREAAAAAKQKSKNIAQFGDVSPNVKRKSVQAQPEEEKDDSGCNPITNYMLSDLRNLTLRK